jgi:hypothetical protein
MNLSETTENFLSLVLEPLFVALRVQHVQLSIQLSLLFYENFSPNIGLKHRINSLGIIANDLVPLMKTELLTEERSVPTSCSTNKTVICDGIGTSLDAMCRRSVDFPIPFLPIRPYRRPDAKVRLAPFLVVISARENSQQT